MSLPRLTITAPNGPPLPCCIIPRESRMASRMKEEFIIESSSGEKFADIHRAWTHFAAFEKPLRLSAAPLAHPVGGGKSEIRGWPTLPAGNLRTPPHLAPPPSRYPQTLKISIYL